MPRMLLLVILGLLELCLTFILLCTSIVPAAVSYLSSSF